jgi:hypothetical protein
MVQVKIHYVLLALGVAAANSDRHQVGSLAVAHRSTLATSAETPEYLITTPAQVTTSSDAATVNVDVAFHRRVVFTNSISKGANATASVSIGPIASADAVRAGGGPPREWISALLDTVVMALLGLTSIVVAVVLGRKQLRAMRVQLHIMLDTAHRHPRVNQVEMSDLESGQYDPDADRIQVRSEITSVDPQRADPIHDSAGFLPEPQPHVVGHDQLAQTVRDHEQPTTQPRGLWDGDDSLHDGLEPREDEGQTPGAMPTAIICSQFGRGRQDSRSLNLDNPKALHPDDRESHPLIIASISIR